MAISIVHWCFICGRQKGKANHWFMALIERGKNLKIFQQWSESKACQPHTLTICGEQCAHTLLSRWLSGDPLSERPSQEGMIHGAYASQQ